MAVLIPHLTSGAPSEFGPVDSINVWTKRNGYGVRSRVGVWFATRVPPGEQLTLQVVQAPPAG